MLHFLFLFFLSFLATGIGSEEPGKRDVTFYRKNSVWLEAEWLGGLCGAARGGIPQARLRLYDGKAYIRSQDDGGRFQGMLIHELTGTYEFRDDIVVISFSGGTVTQHFTVVPMPDKTDPANAQTMSLQYLPAYDSFIDMREIKYLNDRRYVWQPSDYKLYGPDCHHIGLFHLPKPPPKQYFSQDWALYMNRYPGGSPVMATDDADAHRKASEESRSLGLAAYRTGQNPTAIKHYETALNSFANPELYYDYANSLANVGRLADSLKAYQIALNLGHPRPALVHYNLACAHSRLGRLDEAYAQLEKAFRHGYANPEYANKDPDLLKLRARPDWPSRSKLIFSLRP